MFDNDLGPKGKRLKMSERVYKAQFVITSCEYDFKPWEYARLFDEETRWHR